MDLGRRPGRAAAGQPGAAAALAGRDAGRGLGDASPADGPRARTLHAGPGTRALRITLSILAAKELQMIGIAGITGKAYPTGVNGGTSCNALKTRINNNGVPQFLGFGDPNDPQDNNQFEGFVTLTDQGSRLAFLVLPYFEEPLKETALPVSGDKLKYSVMRKMIIV